MGFRFVRWIINSRRNPGNRASISKCLPNKKIKMEMEWTKKLLNFVNLITDTLGIIQNRIYKLLFLNRGLIKRFLILFFLKQNEKKKNVWKWLIRLNDGFMYITREFNWSKIYISIRPSPEFEKDELINYEYTNGSIDSDLMTSKPMKRHINCILRFHVFWFYHFIELD